MRHFEVGAEGRTPALLNPYTEADQLQTANRTSAGSSAAIKDPIEEAKGRLYTSTSDPNQVVLPQPNLFRCLIEAGKFFKVGRKTMTTAKSSLVPGFLDLDGVEYKLFAGGEPILVDPRSHWDVDQRMARNPNSGGGMLKYRPILLNWSFTFHVALDETQASPDLLRQLVDAAGARIGLFDYRPEKKGPFGKWRVVAWDEVSLREVA